MAVTKLGLYNNALLQLGQRKLSAVDEDRPNRHSLDVAYDLDANKFCLEVVRPVFASKTVALTGASTSAEHDLDSVHTLPADFITVVGVYSDSKLDQPIDRYIIEGATLACEYETVYLRYTSDDHVDSFTNWSASFAKVVSSYLARETASKINPGKIEETANLFVDTVDSARALEGEKEPVKRAPATTVTLTDTWRLIYNDALLIMGLPKITANAGDSNRRTQLDAAIDAGIVADMLENIGWQFALESTKSQYDPGIEPAWGYRRAHAEPADMHRIDGIFYDEYMQTPLKLYKHESGYFFTDNDEFYLQYVSTDYLVNPANWPMFFRRLVAAKMAKDAAPSLRTEGADADNASLVFAERESDAKGNDAVQSPPRILSAGNWTRGRYNNTNRDRP